MSYIDHGILGTAGYDAVRKEWCFAKCARVNYATNRNLYDEAKCLNTRSITSFRLRNSNGPVTTPQRNNLSKSSKRLAHFIPELSSCVTFLPEYSEESAVVQRASSFRDPLDGYLIVRGSAREVDKYRDGSSILRSVMIFASGSCSSELSVLQILEKDLLEAGALGSQDCAAPEPLLSFMSPVKQVCFAELNDVDIPSSTFAVRTATGTSLFTLIHSKSLLRGTTDGFSAIKVGEISNDMTGGFQHAHVSFNPWYDRQFAIIDVGGNWCVWEYTGRYAEVQSHHPPKLQAAGTLAGHLDRQPHQGWAKILWGKDVKTLIACQASQIIQLDIAKKSPSPIPLVLIPEAREFSILDIIKCPSRPYELLILTAIHIFLFDTRGSKIYSIWKHNRHAHDTTLNLATSRSAKDIYILVYSRVNNFVSVLKSSIIPDYTHVTKNNWDLLRLPGYSTRSLEISPLPSVAQSALKTRQTCQTGFILAALSRNFPTIYEVKCPRGIDHRTKRRARRKSPLFLNTLLRRHDSQNVNECTFAGLIKSAPVPGNSFLPSYENFRALCFQRQLKRISIMAKIEAGSDFDKQRLYRRLISPTEEYLELFEKSLMNHRNQSAPKLALEIKRPRTLFGDVGNAIQQLETLLRKRPMYSVFRIPLPMLEVVSTSKYSDQVEQRSQARRQTSSNQSAPHSEGSQPYSLTHTATALYEQSMRLWLRYMPLEVSGRVRLKKERLARVISVDVALACFCIRIDRNQSGNDSSQNVEGRDIPLRAAAIEVDEKLTPPRPITTTTPNTLWNFTDSNPVCPDIHDLTRLLEDWPSEGPEPVEYSWVPIREMERRDTNLTTVLKKKPKLASKRAKPAQASSKAKLQASSGRRTSRTSKSIDMSRKSRVYERKMRNEGF